MKDVDIVLLLLRWAHILAAMAAVGGAIYARFAVLPGSAASLDEPQREQLRQAISKKWGKFVHGAIAVLLVTGFWNFFRTSIPPALPAIPYHAIFGVKLLLAFGVFFIATALVGKSPAFESMRRHPRYWLGVLIVMGVLIVLLAGMLNQIRYAHHPSTVPAATVAAPSASPTA